VNKVKEYSWLACAATAKEPLIAKVQGELRNTVGLLAQQLQKSP